MDGRKFKIVIFACLCLALAGLAVASPEEPASPAAPAPVTEIGPGSRFERGPEGGRRGAMLSPEERETFRRNLETWRNLPEADRTALRNLAREKARAEIERALEDSGLRLDQDQREVFGLRYRQERRKLERELQQKVAMERVRRMPEIMARLKTEFATATPRPSPIPTVKPAASPAAMAKPDATATPASSATPAPPFMR